MSSPSIQAAIPDVPVLAQVYGLFLSLLTASADMDACVRAFEEGSLWFGAWAEAGRGDMAPTEMVHIVEQVSCGDYTQSNMGAMHLEQASGISSAPAASQGPSLLLKDCE